MSNKFSLLKLGTTPTNLDTERVMEANWDSIPLIIISLLLLFFFFKLLTEKQERYKNLPPSPPGLPIIGHLHLLKGPLHQTLQACSDKYGPITLLRFGPRKVILVTSPSAVEECFTKNDIIFANRPPSLSGKYLNYNYTSMGSAPYGDLWRNLRRITTLEILSTTRLERTTSIRGEEVKFFVNQLMNNCGGGEYSKVNLNSKFFELSFNVMTMMIMGKRFYGESVDNVGEAKLFQKLIREHFELVKKSNPADLFPVLQWVDLFGTAKKMIATAERMDKFLQKLVDEHKKTSASTKVKTLIHNMLSLQETEPEFYTNSIINGMIMPRLSHVGVSPSLHSVCHLASFYHRRFGAPGTLLRGTSVLSDFHSFIIADGTSFLSFPRSYVSVAEALHVGISPSLHFVMSFKISAYACWVLLIAGSETSSTTLEWAMSLLLNHPDAMTKVKEEIDAHVGQHRLIDEQDLPKLDYLSNVVNEALRLYAPVPLLLPHEASEDCTVGDYDVPQGTTLMVNALAIHRDPKLWENPTKFMPERFQAESAGDGYRLIPFGSGRRGCPGASLAKRMVGLALGALIQSFEWKTVNEEQVDMTESPGITMPKLKPLEASCKPRLSMRKHCLV
ncbi:Cytochrome P450 81C13 [Camellia lanceoleosa]|uniref:Cytochrome P450 81C13 n=1 Tax=Camellia lanceoleosa TaxID=1840588 RepID=A0ACC0GXZ2_9ERIC|nr:Cytochrome P450 81C13 [Camellia lanceoleosa]